MTTRDIPSPTAIHFIIDRCQGILEARHIAEALHIPYEPVDPTDFRDMVRILYRENSSDSYIIQKELPFGILLVNVQLRSNLFPLQHLVQRRGAILEALFRISEGFYFGPHHLILAAFLHFEEKVHRKRLQRADHIPLLFSRLLYHIFEHMGYPTKPHLERRHHCREHFTLNKWTHLTGYPVPVAEPPQVEEASQDEHSIDSVPHAPAPPMPEAVSTVPPLALITPTTLLVPKNTSITPHILPATSSTSEPFMTISTTEFCAMVHLFQTLTTTHNALFRQMEVMRVQLDQQIVILHQIQQLLVILPPPQADIPCPSEPVAPIEDATTAKALIQTTQEAMMRLMVSQL